MSSSPTSSSSSSAELHSFEPLLDVECSVDVIIGTAAITVRDCLKLRPRSVVKLRQTSGADLDLTANGVVVAAGEIVIVDESTAVRVVRIAEPPRAEPEA